MGLFSKQSEEQKLEEQRLKEAADKVFVSSLDYVPGHRITASFGPAYTWVLFDPKKKNDVAAEAFDNLRIVAAQAEVDGVKPNAVINVQMQMLVLGQSQTTFATGEMVKMVQED